MQCGVSRVACSLALRTGLRVEAQGIHQVLRNISTTPAALTATTSPLHRPMKKQEVVHRGLQSSATDDVDAFINDDSQPGPATPQKSATTLSVEMTLGELQGILGQLNQTQICVVDVRNTDNVVKTGMIPGSINVPINDLKKVLRLKEKDFVSETNAKFKPSTNTSSYFVFYGEGPNQAMTALEIAFRCGLKNSRVFSGGWKTWLSVSDS